VDDKAVDRLHGVPTAPAGSRTTLHSLRLLTRRSAARKLLEMCDEEPSQGSPFESYNVKSKPFLYVS